jgi:pimeloyl-ACP methyl ester carboxylesterase
MKLAWRVPLLSTLNTRFIAAIIRRDPARYINLMQRKVHGVDRAVLTQPGIHDMLVADFTEGLRQGGRGMIDDMAANHGKPWGFALEQIQTPVQFWYPALDHSVPPAMGRYLADQVPDAQFHLIENAGHMWALTNLREVLVSVAAKRTEETAQ